MKKFLIGTIFLGLASLGYSQSSDGNQNEKKLSDVEVNATDQVYLDIVSDEGISSKIYTLEREASRYNVKEHPLFNTNNNGRYRVGFSKGKGRIEATYGRNGKILYARENYKNLMLPNAVREAVYEKYSDWTVRSTAYTVYYNGKEAEKKYMVQMEKDGIKKKLKFDFEGNIEK